MPAFADVVYDPQGKSMTGLVVEEHRDRILFNTEQGEKTVLRTQIADIFYSEPERNQFYLGNQSIQDGDYQSAAVFFRKALQINPQFSEAQDGLARIQDSLEKGTLPLSGTSPLQLLEQRWGVQLQEGGNGAVIFAVESGSFGDRVGLKAGDRLIAYWGESLSYLPAQEVASSMLGNAGTTLKLTIQRRLVLDPEPQPIPWPGMKIDITRLGWAVRALDAVGPSAKAGFLAGDRIVKINGQSTRYMPASKINDSIQSAKNQGMSAFIERDLTIIRE
jgi:predicted metalloprotease with PDZ domain